MLVWLLMLDGVSGNPNRLDVDPSAITKCASNEIFSTVSLKCESCPRNRIGDPDFLDSAGRAARCVCPAGSVASCDNCDCVTCPESSLRDGSGCVACGATTGILAGECTCSANERLVEREQTGELVTDGKACAQCPAGSVKVSLHECEACPDSKRMSSSSTAQNKCECNLPFQTLGLASLGERMCAPAAQVGEILSRFPTPLSARFERVQRSSDSGDSNTATLDNPLWMAHYYPWAATKCAFHDGTPESDRACQCLTNLCVMSRYDTSEAPCALVNELQSVFNSRQQRRIPEIWWRGSEWVLPMTMTAKTKMRFELAKYSLNGSLVGYERLSTQLFWGGRRAPWTGTGIRATTWLRFGTSYADSFQVSLDDQLTQQQEPVFYELYLVLDDRSWLPLPIDMRIARTRLRNDVRRFFLVDAGSGLVDFDEETSILRYASSIALAIEAQRNGPKNKIRPPRLRIAFRERTRNSIKTDMRVDTIEFVATYSAAPNKRLLWGFTFAGLSAVIALFAVALARQRIQNPISAATSILQSFVAVFLPLEIAVSTYYFCAFKFQDPDEGVRLLLPSESKAMLLAIGPMITALWVAQTVVLIVAVAKHATAQFAFVDWEEDSPSSWRAILVANELFELSAERATSLPFTLTWLLFVMIDRNFQYNATPQPDLEKRYGGIGDLRSPLLDFANSAWWFILLSVFQLLFRGGILHAFVVENPKKRFVDLCSLAKISLFSEKFYVHGDSPHHADQADLADLANTVVTDKWEGAIVGREFRVDTLSLNFKQAWHNVKGDKTTALTTRESHFLRTFLSHGYADKFGVDFAVVHATAPQPKPGKSIFVPDATSRPWPFNLGKPAWLYDVALMQAHELVFLAHELLTYAFVQIVCTENNHAVAIAITFASYRLIAAISHHASKPNVARQSQVDVRFLL